MKWNSKISNHYLGLVQTSQEGTSRAFRYYYIKKNRGYGISYTAGRFTFGREIDYREIFPTLKEAREFCESIDRETVIIEAVNS